MNICGICGMAAHPGPCDLRPSSWGAFKRWWREPRFTEAQAYAMIAGAGLLLLLFLLGIQ